MDRKKHATCLRLTTEARRLCEQYELKYFASAAEFYCSVFAQFNACNALNQQSFARWNFCKIIAKQRTFRLPKVA